MDNVIQEVSEKGKKFKQDIVGSVKEIEKGKLENNFLDFNNVNEFWQNLATSTLVLNKERIVLGNPRLPWGSYMERLQYGGAKWVNEPRVKAYFSDTGESAVRDMQSLGPGQFIFLQMVSLDFTIDS